MKEMKLLLAREQKLEQKDQKRSAAITTGIAALLILLSLFWTAMAGTIPPIGEPAWKTIGMVSDFGNLVDGSGDVDNFHQPSPNPADRPKVDQATSNPKTNPAPSESPKVVESNSPSDQSTSTSNSNNSNHTSTQTNNPKSSETSTTTTGGSNDGKSTNIGNNGNPKSTTLDGNGMFDFGPGIGGSAGRKLIKLDLPKYNVQQEARIKFNFIVLPDGKVAFVKADANTYPELAKVGKEAIEKWRFSEVDESEGNLRTSVVITFRLQ